MNPTNTPGTSTSKLSVLLNDSGQELSHETTDSCVICLAAISERAVAYPCNHLVFDFLCLASWLQQRPTCPLCNVPVQRVEYDWRSPNDHKTYIVPKPDQAPSTSFPNRRNHTRPPRGRGSSGRGRAFRNVSPPTPDAALERRRLVHARNAFSLHRAPSRPKHVMPATFRAEAGLQRKARVFLRRELRVFRYLESSSRLEFVLEYIVGMLRKLELKGADGAMQGLVAELVGAMGARLLLHELGAWLETAFDRLEDWDAVVQYADVEVMRFRVGRGVSQGGIVSVQQPKGPHDTGGA